MKNKFILLLVLLALILPQSATGQHSSQLAVKTNVAYLAAGVANIGAEIGFGKHFSVDIPFLYSPYTIRSDYKLRILGLQPEFRCWMKQPLKGHFLGIHGTVGWFNTAVNSDKRYQDSRPLWGVGVSYGYMVSLGRHWGTEFTIGGGYGNIGYNTYVNEENGVNLGTRTKEYWGITRVGITLIYKFKL